MSNAWPARSAAAGAMREVLRLEELLFPSVRDIAVLSVGVSNEAIRIEAQCTMAGADRAGCAGWSERVHNSYLRFPADVPSAGKRVRLCLRVRRFVCENALCERRTSAASRAPA